MVSVSSERVAPLGMMRRVQSHRWTSKQREWNG